MVREECVMVMLSEQEKEALRQKADKEGLTMSAYIRRILNKGGK